MPVFVTYGNRCFSAMETKKAMQERWLTLFPVTGVRIATNGSRPGQMEAADKKIR